MKCIIWNKTFDDVTVGCLQLISFLCPQTADQIMDL